VATNSCTQPDLASPPRLGHGWPTWLENTSMKFLYFGAEAGGGWQDRRKEGPRRAKQLFPTLILFFHAEIFYEKSDENLNISVSQWMLCTVSVNVTEQGACRVKWVESHSMYTRIYIHLAFFNCCLSVHIDNYTIIIPTKCTRCLLLKAQDITICTFLSGIFAPTCFNPRGLSSGGSTPVSG
jgi:hypothetical protein